MSTQDVLAIVSIAVSTILSIGAVVLSIWFFYVSNQQNKETALMQSDIKNAIEKLEHLYDKTYTDTFGALKTQIDAMQRHIFSPSIGETNASEPNHLRFTVIGILTASKSTTVDLVCEKASGFDKYQIKDMLNTLSREGLINFDGANIKTIKIGHRDIEGDTSIHSDS